MVSTDKAELPRLTMGERSIAPRIVGGKTYCTLHGIAHSDNGKGCPVCERPTEPRRYVNIILQTSAKGIGGVISDHFVGTSAEIADRRQMLKNKHGVR
jgi:hypothetical protein